MPLTRGDDGGRMTPPQRVMVPDAGRPGEERCVFSVRLAESRREKEHGPIVIGMPGVQDIATIEKAKEIRAALDAVIAAAEAAR